MGRFMLNNLPFDASEGDIENMLIGLGIAADNVLSINIPKGHNGIGRGFAVVELYDTANAIGLVPGFEYEDRFITVSYYDPSARTGLCEPSYYRDEISEDRDMFCRDRERPRRDRSSYKWNQPEERREPRQEGGASEMIMFMGIFPIIMPPLDMAAAMNLLRLTTRSRMIHLTGTMEEGSDSIIILTHSRSMIARA